MPQTVTLDTIHKGAKYPPLPGTRYEVAPGHHVTLKEATFGLAKEAAALLTRFAGAANPLRQRVRSRLEGLTSDLITEDVDANEQARLTAEALADVREMIADFTKGKAADDEPAPEMPDYPDVELCRLITDGSWDEIDPAACRPAIARRAFADFQRQSSDQPGGALG